MRVSPLAVAAVIGVAAAVPRAVFAQTDSTKVKIVVDSAFAVLDSAQKTGSTKSTVQSAGALYAAAVTMLDGRNYKGAAELAKTTISLARSARPTDAGPHIDSIPFAVDTVGPGEPPIKPSVP
jgi:hypothetical protein